MVGVGSAERSWMGAGMFGLATDGYELSLLGTEWYDGLYPLPINQLECAISRLNESVLLVGSGNYSGWVWWVKVIAPRSHIYSMQVIKGYEKVDISFPGG